MWFCEGLYVVGDIRQGIVCVQQVSDRSTDTHFYTHIITASWVLSSPEVILYPSDLICFLFKEAVYGGSCSETSLALHLKSCQEAERVANSDVQHFS